jgi:hypothetical protein
LLPGFFNNQFVGGFVESWFLPPPTLQVLSAGGVTQVFENISVAMLKIIQLDPNDTLAYGGTHEIETIVHVE